MLGTERGDGRRARVHPHEVHGHIAMRTESAGDRESCRQRTAEAVDQHVHRFPLVSGKDIVHVVTVKVTTAHVPLQMKVVICVFHRFR